MYCVVEILEKGQAYCLAVPTTWVKNGKLQQPKLRKDLIRLRKSHGQPDATWLVQDCIVLKSNIRKYSIYSRLYMNHHPLDYPTMATINNLYIFILHLKLILKMRFNWKLNVSYTRTLMLLPSPQHSNCRSGRIP